MWEAILEEWHEAGVIEYGIYQRDRKPHAPIWRRHRGASNFRFASIFNALFAEKELVTLAMVEPHTRRANMLTPVNY